MKRTEPLTKVVFNSLCERDASELFFFLFKFSVVDLLSQSCFEERTK